MPQCTESPVCRQEHARPRRERRIYLHLHQKSRQGASAVLPPRRAVHVAVAVHHGAARPVSRTERNQNHVWAGEGNKKVIPPDEHCHLRPQRHGRAAAVQDQHCHRIHGKPRRNGPCLLHARACSAPGRQDAPCPLNTTEKVFLWLNICIGFLGLLGGLPWTAYRIYKAATAKA